MFETVLSNSAVGGGEHDHRHLLVDQRDRAVLELARRITFGVDVADFLQLQRALPARADTSRRARGTARRGRGRGRGRSRRSRARARAPGRGGPAPCRAWRRGAPPRPASMRPRCAGGGDRQRGEHGQLAGEGLGRGDADLRAGEDRQRHVALARDRRGLDVDDRDDAAALRLDVAQRRQGVGGLARLADEEPEGAGAERRLAVAELGGDLDLDRQAGEALEPVFRHVAGVVRGAAGDEHDPVAAGEVDRPRAAPATRSGAR